MLNKYFDYILGVRPYKCPDCFINNHIHIELEKENILMKSLLENYFTIPTYYKCTAHDYVNTEVGTKDLNDHLFGRLNYNRHLVIPWIDNTKKLENSNILEIGCGTGSSTLALKEQGANIVACDVEQGSIEVAKKRLELCNMNVDFIVCNANDIHNIVNLEEFDLITFFAVLEHMTASERLSTLRNIWNKIKPGTYIVILETPNRLWFHDFHTSHEHFFLWLPDEIAKLYAKNTKREIFNNIINKDTDEITLARWGRGVSYHDFSLAFDIEPGELPVVSCMELYKRKLTKRDKYYKKTVDRKYEELLNSFMPDIHRSFFLKWIDIILQKN